MPVTITELAKQLGVSHVTVSHALRGTGRVSEALRATIRAAAEAQGYKPHAAARAIRDGRHGAVALLHGSGYDRGRLPLSLLEGLQDGAEDAGWRLLLTRLRGDTTEPDVLPRLLTEWAADGLIGNFGERIPDILATEIATHRLPAIWLNARLPSDCVVPDDEQAGRLAAKHLLTHGHRRIAYVDASLRDDQLARAHSSIRLREAGCRGACAAAGAECRVLRRANDADDGIPSQLRTLLAAPDRPTAIVGYGSSALEPALGIARELGMRIPEDLSVVGFDSGPIGHFPRVDTVLIPSRELGIRSVEQLARKIDAPDRALEPLLLSCDLAVGHSVSAAT